MFKKTLVFFFGTLLIFSLFACSNVEKNNADVLEQMKREDLSRASKPIPKNFPPDVPLFTDFKRVADSGEFGRELNDGSVNINPIVWIEVEDEETLNEALVFYRERLKRTRYRTYKEKDGSNEQTKNIELRAEISPTESLTFNFISNYLGVPVVRIGYYKQTTKPTKP